MQQFDGDEEGGTHDTDDTHVGQLDLVVELVYRPLPGFSGLVRQKRAT